MDTENFMTKPGKGKDKYQLDLRQHADGGRSAIKSPIPAPNCNPEIVPKGDRHFAPEIVPKGHGHFVPEIVPKDDRH